MNIFIFSSLLGLYLIWRMYVEYQARAKIRRVIQSELYDVLTNEKFKVRGKYE